MSDVLVQCHFCLQPSLSPEIPLLHSHLVAFGIFTLGPSLFSDVAAHVGEQLLHFTQSRSCWPEGKKHFLLVYFVQSEHNSCKSFGMQQEKVLDK